ncbi:Fungalysin metallopeptidase (M36), partial [Rhizoctonia solani]
MTLLVRLTALALLISSGVIAAPWDPAARHTTHRSRSVGPKAIEASAYQPESTYETYGVNGIDHPFSKRGITVSPQEAAKSFLASKLGLDASELVRRAGHIDNSTRVANEYFRQQFNGIPVANAVANVAVRDDKVLSFGASFIKATSIAPTTPKFPKQNAIDKAESLTGAKYNSFPVGLEYFAKDTDQVVLTHTVQVQNTATMEWYLVYIDASNGDVINLVDFTAEASYRVIPFTSQDPRDGFQVINNPHDPVSSPNGWHQYGSTKTTDTSGNNVISYASSTGETTTQSSATNNYNYEFNPKAEPNVSPNLDAARVNAFYVSNMVHDLTNNNGLGGAQGDRVYILVQDSLITNNAAFSTPPDGQPGVMRTFFWTYTSPRRDGALENDIITHEYGHGISNRLTGGGTATCLQTTEAAGLGEGWSDALAEWTEQTSGKEKDFTLGSYVNTQSIRTYPYSTNMATNPRTYATLKGLGDDDLHSIGEVWALIWHEIYVALIAKYGFTTNKNDPMLSAGNTVALHLFIDGLKLQPCNPTFISARDAVIQADANRYSGANKCLLWKAYAKRGLGYGATTTKLNSMTVPQGC